VPSTQRGPSRHRLAQVTVPVRGRRRTYAAERSPAPTIGTHGLRRTRLLRQSSVNSTLNEAGFGNDNTGPRSTVQRFAVPLTTDWTLVVIPIPDRRASSSSEACSSSPRATRTTRLHPLVPTRSASPGWGPSSARARSWHAQLRHLRRRLGDRRGHPRHLRGKRRDVEVTHSPRYFDYFLGRDGRHDRGRRDHGGRRRLGHGDRETRHRPRRGPIALHC